MGQKQSAQTIEDAFSDVSEIIPGKLYLSSVGVVLCEMSDSGVLRGRLGVDAVVSVTGRDLSLSGMSHLHLKLQDNRSADLFRAFDEALLFIEDHCKKGRVLVHCEAGKSRSATLVMAFCIKSGLCSSAEDAFEFVKKRRPCVEPNVGFVYDLIRYECFIKERGEELPNEAKLFLARYWVTLCNLQSMCDVDSKESLMNAYSYLEESDFHSGEACIKIAQKK